ncbi:MAG: MFS transporter [Ruminococcaceae bacterium]|nr:MFS transporter [Oscillospiraceae bacterium]
MTLLLNSLAHFLVDALCITTLFSAGAEGETLLTAVLFYNTLAFSTQCVVGLLIDRFGGCKGCELAAFALVILGFALPLPFFLRVALVGAGNSLFHVAAGTVTLQRSAGKAWQLGVFVAPGAFGVTLGTLAPRFGWILSAAMLLCAVVLAFRKDGGAALAKPGREGGKFPLLPVLLLTFAVAVRALGGVAVSFPWKQTALHAVLMTFFVFAGKSAGGFVCDRLGEKRSAWLSIPLAAVCIAFFSFSMPASLLGQFLLNLTMPVTLWLLYRLMPDAPGFAFGLAASALWPGTIAGYFISLSGPWLWAFVIGTFGFGLIAILYASAYLNKHEWRESR